MKGKKGDKGGTGPKSRGDAKGQKGGSQPTVEAPILTVQEFSKNQSLDSKISALDGTNLRHLRDGLGPCSPGIVGPGKRQRKSFWKAIRKLLLGVCDRNILTSGIIRSPGMLKALQGNF